MREFINISNIKGRKSHLKRIAKRLYLVDAIEEPKQAEAFDFMRELTETVLKVYKSETGVPLMEWLKTTLKNNKTHE